MRFRSVRVQRLPLFAQVIAIFKKELELRILHCDATTQTAELTNCDRITATGVAPSTEQGDTARFLHADRFSTFKIYNEIESDFLPLTT